MIKLESYNSKPYLYSLDSSGRVTGKSSNFTKLQESESSCFRDMLTKQSGTDMSLRSMGVADFSNLREFKATGNSEWDKNIQSVLNYYSSCFDFTNSRDYEQFTAKEDFTGMSNACKYKAIYEKYQHCYGENFLEASAGDYGLIPFEYDVYSPVIRRFNEEVNEACGGEAEAVKARRDALYGEDLSDTEVRRAIIEKYVVNGKITNRDYNKMTNEMDLCGVGGGIRNSNTQSDKIPVNIFDYLRERGMDTVADRIMKSCMTDKEINAYYSDYAQRAVCENSEALDSYMTADDFNVLMKGYEHRVYLKNVKPEYGEALKQILNALD